MLNNKIKFRAIILAGGKGSRLGDITKKTPKPLIKVLNKEFLFYLINFLKINNVDEIIVTTNYKKNLFIKFFNDIKFKNIKIKNENKVLGTGGSFLKVAKSLKFEKNTINFVCNADTLFLFSIRKIKKQLIKNDFIILSLKKNNCKRYGKLILKNNNVIDIKRSQNTQGHISSGFFFFKKFDKNIINKNKEKLDFENDILRTMLKKKIKIKSISLNSPFIDIGVIKELKKSKIFIKEQYNEFIKKL